MLRARSSKGEIEAGALVIKMRMEKLNDVVMNHKKIRCNMRKFGLVATIRQANPYRKMAKQRKNIAYVLTIWSVNSIKGNQRRSFFPTLHTCAMAAVNGRIYLV